MMTEQTPPGALKCLIAHLEQARDEYNKDPRRGTRLALLAVILFVQHDLEDTERPKLEQIPVIWARSRHV
jgi:hypothetical protein